MKRYYLLFILFLIGLFLPIPSYVELNHLMIVESVGLDCSNHHYRLYFKEIIPKGGDYGTDYDYQIYSGVGKTLKDAYQSLDSHSNKKIFLTDVNQLVTNCYSTKDIRKFLSIHPSKIIHTKKSIIKELK